eukprot:m.63161 g.63161  ORF g.63161 m.63161 type:complete len:93 (-) comp8059_c0_seq6:955-1233(-)
MLTVCLCLYFHTGWERELEFNMCSCTIEQRKNSHEESAHVKLKRTEKEKKKFGLAEPVYIHACHNSGPSKPQRRNDNKVINLYRCTSSKEQF